MTHRWAERKKIRTYEESAKVHPGFAFIQNGKYANMSEGRGMKIAEGGHWSLQSLCMYRITVPNLYVYPFSFDELSHIFACLEMECITAAFSQFMRGALGVAIGITSSLG